MADVIPVIVDVDNGASKLVKWENHAGANAELALPVGLSSYGDRSIQFIGTFNSANIIVEGSNDPEKGAGSWVTLKNIHGTDLSAITAPVIHQIAQVPLFLRCRFSVAATPATDIDIYMLCRRNNPSRQ